MKPVDANFVPPHRRWLGLGLLLGAIAVAVDTGLSIHDLSLRQGTMTAPATPPSTAEMLAAQRVAGHLARDWPALLTSVEQAASKVPGLRLSALEPDAERGSVRLSGEAPDAAGVLSFVRQLEAGGVLQGIYPLSQRGGGRQEFVLAARWGRGS